MSTPPPQAQTSTPPPAQTSTSATVNIVSSSGSGAFTPNPVQVASGGTVVWKNDTNVSHVLVMNDGTSIGTVAPGASITKTITSGGNYRCTIHPSMVGSINGAAAPPAPTPDDSGY